MLVPLNKAMFCQNEGNFTLHIVYNTLHKNLKSRYIKTHVTYCISCLICFPVTNLCNQKEVFEKCWPFTLLR